MVTMALKSVAEQTFDLLTGTYLLKLDLEPPEDEGCHSTQLIFIPQILLGNKTFKVVINPHLALYVKHHCIYRGLEYMHVNS